MEKETKQYKTKLKYYHVILIGCFLAPLLVINSNLVNKNRVQELFKNKVLRLLDDSGDTEASQGNKTGSDKICEMGSENLVNYYKTGNLEEIDLDDKPIKSEDKDKEYMKALINIIKQVAGGDNKQNATQSTNNGPQPSANGGRLRNLELSIDSVKDDLIAYLMHILPILAFIVIAILSIPGWIICCFCNCCNCCCCCCCKKVSCRIPCFIFTYVFYGLSVAICIYGLSQSNNVFVGLANTECSLLKFVGQVLDGETKTELPRWAGIQGINSILSNLTGEINQMSTTTLGNLNTKMDNITEQKGTFISAMTDSPSQFKVDNVVNPYKKSYACSSLYAVGDYTLDLVYNWGHFDTDTQSFQPTSSTLGMWEEEYKEVANTADGYLTQAQTDFTTILGNQVGDLIRNLQDGTKKLDEIKSSFNSIEGGISDLILDNYEMIDTYGRLGFKIVFGSFGLLNIILALLMLLICLCSGKSCACCCGCCCRCIFKCCTHLIWNILALLMIVIFLVGVLLSLIGQIGSDAMSIISYLVSEDNLGVNGTIGGDNILVDQLGDSKQYLDKCINGDGKITDLLGLGDKLDSFNDLNETEYRINTTRDEFNERKTFVTYTIYKTLFEDEASLSREISLLPNSPSLSSVPLEFGAILEEMNSEIDDSVLTRRDKWKIGSSETADCSASGSNYEFNPLKCSPYERGWVTSASSNIKERAKILSDILEMLEIGKGSSSYSYMIVLDDLKEKYNNFLDSYIDALEFFGAQIRRITIKTKEFSGDGDLFSFIRCNFIGYNLKIILKYLKSALGTNIKTVGICLLVVGCSLILSISSTILLIVIINISLKENEEEKKKENEEKISGENTVDEAPVESEERVIKYNGE